MKKFGKKAAAVILAGTMTMSFCIPSFAGEVSISGGDKPYIALGADLSDSQRSTVLSLFGLSEADLSDYDVVTVTNAQEHEYLDSYIPYSTIGTNALSSVVVWEASEGSGINVTTKNITYCTTGMYSNALATAGVTDANVIVAAPSEMSGTAALIGAIEAYSVMTGTTIDPDIIDGAVNEIVTTGLVEEATGYTDEIEGIIAYLKDEIDEIYEMSDEEIDEEIRKAADSFGIWLYDEEVVEIRELLKKLKGLDLDWDAISQQAQDVYDQLEESGYDLAGLDLGSLGINMDNETFVDRAKGVFDNVMDFFKGVFRRS